MISDVDKYTETLPEDTKLKFQSLRKAINESVPEGEERISYKIPAIRIKSGYVVYFAAWKNHISLYPFTSEIEKLLPETKRYNTSGKGTIQFPLNEDLPLPLIKKIVKLMVKRTEERKKDKAK